MSKNRVRILLAAVAFGAAVMTGPVAKADTYGELYDAVNWLGNKYGVTLYVSQAPLEDGTYAVTNYDTITFNSLYVNDPAALRANMVADVSSGYHPGAHCTPEQALAAHEFAHVLDNFTGHTADIELESALASGLSGEVSGYSFESYDEALAEAFVAVECDVPTPAETAIYNMLAY